MLFLFSEMAFYLGLKNLGAFEASLLKLNLTRSTEAVTLTVYLTSYLYNIIIRIMSK